MAKYDNLQDPYLATLDLKTSEYLTLYIKAITRLSDNDRYDIKSSKWIYFYQELEYDVSTFGFNAAV